MKKGIDQVQRHIRPARENRRKPSLFGFHYCHLCKKANSLDDLALCSRSACQQFFCYQCLKKVKQKKTTDLPPHLVFPKAEFQKLKENKQFVCLSCKGQCPCKDCDQNSLAHDLFKLNQDAAPALQRQSMEMKQQQFFSPNIEDSHSDPIYSTSQKLLSLKNLSNTQTPVGDKKTNQLLLSSGQTAGKEIEERKKDQKFQGIKGLGSQKEKKMEKDTIYHSAKQLKFNQNLSEKTMVKLSLLEEEQKARKEREAQANHKLILSSGRSIKRPKGREMFRDDFTDSSPDADQDDDDEEYSDQWKEPKQNEFGIRRHARGDEEFNLGSFEFEDSSCLNYDLVKKNLLKDQNEVNVTEDANRVSVQLLLQSKLGTHNIINSISFPNNEIRSNWPGVQQSGFKEVIRSQNQQEQQYTMNLPSLQNFLPQISHLERLRQMPNSQYDWSLRKEESNEESLFQQINNFPTLQALSQLQQQMLLQQQAIQQPYLFSDASQLNSKPNQLQEDLLMQMRLQALFQQPNSYIPNNFSSLMGSSPLDGQFLSKPENDKLKQASMTNRMFNQEQNPFAQYQPDPIALQMLLLQGQQNQASLDLAMLTQLPQYQQMLRLQEQQDFNQTTNKLLELNKLHSNLMGQSQQFLGSELNQHQYPQS